jgi:DNA-binding transcriptional MerR regulator
MSAPTLEKEFTAKEVQSVLRVITGGTEKIGLALLNYYSRTNLVPSTGKGLSRGRKKYSYADLVLLCWLFRMKREGLPVNRFRRGIDYLRKKLPKLHQNPKDMILLTDGKQLFIKHRVDEKVEIAEALTGKKAGQYVWAYAIGSLIEEIDKVINDTAIYTLEIENETSTTQVLNQQNTESSDTPQQESASVEASDTSSKVVNG